MNNPWASLPAEAPYVLPDDAEAIASFNAKAKPDFRIQTSLLPEPYVGNLEAPVLLLALNPGYSQDDEKVHSSKDFQTIVRECINQEPVPYPYYYLNPSFDGPGFDWTRKRLLGPLVRAFGAEKVAQKVAMVEFFPYHSTRFSHSKIHLKSQDFILQKVQSRLDDVQAIVVTRGWKIWTEAIKELNDNPKVHRTRSVQNTTISPRNVPEGWDTIAAAIS